MHQPVVFPLQVVEIVPRQNLVNDVGGKRMSTLNYRSREATPVVRSKMLLELQDVAAELDIERTDVLRLIARGNLKSRVVGADKLRVGRVRNFESCSHCVTGRSRRAATGLRIHRSLPFLKRERDFIAIST
ncbi:MAG: hypothetical protein ABGZ23_09070 [Fuerstiella sp.]